MKVTINVTLLGGVVQETSDNPVTPLRLDLLGAEVLSLNKTQGLVSFQTTLPYDGIRLQMKGGLATALSTADQATLTTALATAGASVSTDAGHTIDAAFNTLQAAFTFGT